MCLAAEEINTDICWHVGKLIIPKEWKIVEKKSYLTLRKFRKLAEHLKCFAYRIKVTFGKTDNIKNIFVPVYLCHCQTGFVGA